jgi:hypothetical protein
MIVLLDKEVTGNTWGFICFDCNTHTTHTYDAQTLSQQFRLVKLELQVVTQIRHPMIVNFMGVAVKFPTANENPNNWYFRQTHSRHTNISLLLLNVMRILREKLNRSFVMVY